MKRWGVGKSNMSKKCYMYFLFSINQASVYVLPVISFQASSNIILAFCSLVQSWKALFSVCGRASIIDASFSTLRKEALP